MSKLELSKDFCRRSLFDPVRFWSEQAQRIYWHEPYREVCRCDRDPFAHWFVGGRTNLCYNAVDRHLAERGSQIALHFVSSETGEERAYTLKELSDETHRFAGVLRSLGLRRGDRVVIYLPMVPEAVFAMLACARLGIIHSVVFAGFAPASLATRIDDAEAALLITADAGLRGGKLIPLKRLADEAVALARHKPRHLLVLDRDLDPTIAWDDHRDLDYRTRAAAQKEEIAVEWLESSEPSYLLYTSGTTASPKGIQRDTGGYAVALATSMEYVFATRLGESIFTAADIGWAVGHSYLVYGPLIQGIATILYEGLPIRPDPGIWWEIVARIRPRVMFTSPTAIRTLKKQDPEYLRRHDTTSLQRLYLAGEPLDEATWRWISEALQIPVIDNYWQTETGWPALTLLPGIEKPEIKPGSPGIAMPGYAAEIVDPLTGQPLPRNHKGILAFHQPLPPGCMTTVWRNDDLFSEHYFSRFTDFRHYSTFDYAVQDDDGYFFILGRSDDVINVSGHRLGTREIEETICSLPAVAEAAAVGARDEIKGQAVHCFVVLKAGQAEADGENWKKEIATIIVERLGAFCRPAAIHLVKSLPKTRSGKILRRAILAAAEGRDTGDLSTLEDPGALTDVREAAERG